MKTFLENLKNELKKRDFSDADIEEILADHKEMIEMAKNDGLEDDELIEKFGDPKKLAEDLGDGKSNDKNEERDVDMNGYKLYKTFPVIDKHFDVSISIVSDDVDYLVHDEDQIEVYYKDIKNIDNYNINFDTKEFSIDHKQLSSIFNFRLKSGGLIIKVPKDLVHKTFTFKNVSGQAKLEMIETNYFDLKTTSGDLTVKNVKAEIAKIRTVSGDLKLYDFALSSLDATMVSGDAKFYNMTVSGDFDCQTVSGDVFLNHGKAKIFNLKSVSGDCKGLEFYPENVKLKSISGDIHITNNETDTEINIISKKTMSGDISINNKDMS